MVNTTKKGADLEGKGGRVLKHHGYLVHHTVRTPFQRGGRWFSNTNDVFGCFDLIGTRQGHAAMPARMRFVQVTVIEDVAKRREKVHPVALNFPWVGGDGSFNLELHVSAEVWGWIGGRRGAVENAQSFKVWRWSNQHLDWIQDGYEVLPTAAELKDKDARDDEEV